MELRIFLSEMQKRHLRSCPLHNVDENSREIELSLGQLGCLAFAVVWMSPLPWTFLALHPYQPLARGLSGIIASPNALHPQKLQ